VSISFGRNVNDVIIFNSYLEKLGAKLLKKLKSTKGCTNISKNNVFLLSNINQHLLII